MPIKSFNNKQPKIGKGTYIDESAVIIGEVSIADNVSIWPMAVIRGDVASIHIGADTNIQDGAVLHGAHANKFHPKESPLRIGKGVTVGHQATVHACTVGDYCLVGIGAVILDNTIMEDYVMLGAGSLVAAGKVLESGHLYVGSPARKIRTLSDKEKEFLRYSASHYVELKDEYLAAQ